MEQLIQMNQNDDSDSNNDDDQIRKEMERDMQKGDDDEKDPFLQGPDANLWFLYKASPQQGDLRLLDPLSGQGISSGTLTSDRKVPAEFQGRLANHCVTDAPFH
ncbi:hypothetical protein PoB_004922900 [Plakobranchus ocellatus]|uniref:Uncharacterized protein n=1 Tax=Plakobranchus ocellatus TaxID=259542 RepID=A0AAV4BWE5_9GAST|nr:hypothetical protein PoB_004922900 [Plakobranchus ocellatus]